MTFIYFKGVFSSIQQRILRFLGKLGEDNIHFLNSVNNSKQGSCFQWGLFINYEDVEETVAWDTQQRVQFTLPFPDVKTNLFLGTVCC